MPDRHPMRRRHFSGHHWATFASAGRRGVASWLNRSNQRGGVGGPVPLSDGGNSRAKIGDKAVEGCMPLFTIMDANDRCRVQRRDNRYTTGSTLQFAPLLRNPE